MVCNRRNLHDDLKTRITVYYIVLETFWECKQKHHTFERSKCLTSWHNKHALLSEWMCSMNVACECRRLNLYFSRVYIFSCSIWSAVQADDWLSNNQNKTQQKRRKPLQCKLRMEHYICKESTNNDKW